MLYVPSKNAVHACCIDVDAVPEWLQPYIRTVGSELTKVKLWRIIKPNGRILYAAAGDYVVLQNGDFSVLTSERFKYLMYTREAE